MTTSVFSPPKRAQGARLRVWRADDAWYHSCSACSTAPIYAGRHRSWEGAMRGAADHVCQSVLKARWMADRQATYGRAETA